MLRDCRGELVADSTYLHTLAFKTLHLEQAEAWRLLFWPDRRSSDSILLTRGSTAWWCRLWLNVLAAGLWILFFAISLQDRIRNLFAYTLTIWCSSRITWYIYAVLLWRVWAVGLCRRVKRQELLRSQEKRPRRCNNTTRYSWQARESIVYM